MRKLLSAALFILAGASHAQVLQQAGPWTPGHAPMYTQPSTGQPRVMDSGPAGGSSVANAGLRELLLVVPPSPNAGLPPYANTGTGPYDTNVCDYDAPITSAGGYHYLCFSPNAGIAGSNGVIAFGAVNAPQIPFEFIVNGTSYQFPFVTGGIVGPSTTTIGDPACWNNTTGTLLKDCSGSGTVYLIASNNLSDLGSVPAARGNLGLGTATPTGAGAAVLNANPTITGANLVGANLNQPTAVDLTYATNCSISGCVTGLYPGTAAILGRQPNTANAFLELNSSGAIPSSFLPSTTGSAGFASLLDYGGVASSATGTCTTTASSNSLNCSNVADFAPGHGIRVDKAGIAFAYASPTAPTVTPCGSPPSGNTCSPGGTSYAYECAAIDVNGGVGVASPSGTTSSGPSTLGVNAFNKITCPTVSGAPGYVFYGNKSGSLALIGIVWGTNIMEDFGSTVNPTVPADDWLPTPPLATAQRDWLLTTVSSVANPNIIVATAASAGVTGTAYHDNSSALTQALAAAPDAVVIPCGIFQTIGLSYTLSNAPTITGNNCGQLALTTSILGSAFFNVVAGTEIEDLTIYFPEDGNNLETGISCGSSCTGLFINHVSFEGVPPFGLYIGPGYGVLITNNVFLKTTPRVSQNKCINVGTSGSDIVESFITGNTCDGTSMQLVGSNSSFSDNNISGWGYGGGMGIGGDSASLGDTIAKNVVANSLTGVDVNNTIHDCYETYVAYSSFTGNIGAGCGGTGLLINGQGDSVSGNSMYNNGTSGGGGLNQAGIAVQYITTGYNGSGSYSSIVGNTISNTGSGTQLYGIYANSSSLTFCEQGNNGESLTTNVVLNGATNSCF